MSEDSADACELAENSGSQHHGFRPGNPYAFKKGNGSPNPGGRPKALKDVIALAREKGPAAIATLTKLMTSAKDDRVRLEAAKTILERGFGRPISAR